MHSGSRKISCGVVVSGWDAATKLHLFSFYFGVFVRSIPVLEGLYQYEFLKDKIALAKWDEPPPSTSQWVYVNGSGFFIFEGTNNENIRVIRLKDKNDE